MPMKIASMKKEKPSIAKPRPKTPPKLAVKLARSRSWLTCYAFAGSSERASPRCCPVLEPAAASEECEEREEGGDLGADAEDEEHRPAVDVGNHPVKVLAEETGDERQRQKDGGDDRQLLHHRVDSVRDG